MASEARYVFMCALRHRVDVDFAEAEEISHMPCAECGRTLYLLGARKVVR